MGFSKKRSMVLALFYVVAIQPVAVRVAMSNEAIKSVHFQAAKLKQFLQSGK